MTTVVAFLVALGLLIVVHEWGHFRAARAFDVKVLRFSVGFGRVVWRRTGRDGTEFALSALPLGGYVKMLDGREGAVDPAERARAFDAKPLWQRAVIVAAGPIANLVLAVLLYAATWWVGVDEPKAVLATPVAGSVAERAGLQSGDWVRRWRPAGAGDEAWDDVASINDLRWNLVQAALAARALELETTDASGRGLRRVTLALDTLDAADADAQLVRRIGLAGVHAEPLIGRVVDGGPASNAGLRRGDRVLQVDGVAIVDAAQLRERIRGAHAADDDAAAAPVRTQRWRLERGAQRVDVEVRPRAVREGGVTFGRIDAEIGAAPAMVHVRAGVVDGLERGLRRTWEVAALSVKMIGRMLVGQASLKNLSGPLTIADHAGQSASMGLVAYLGFLAMVSVSLGVLNLLPLPMLDGGHLMIYIVEGLTGRPVSDAAMARWQRGGVAILLLLMSVALFNDVARLLGLH